MKSDLLIKINFVWEKVNILVAKKTVQPQEEKKKCLKCQKEKYLRDYYISYSSLHADQKVPVCKICLSDMFEIEKPKESLQEILRQIDKPYISDVFATSVLENPENIFGKYMKNIGMRQYKNMAWKDSSSESKKNEKSDEYQQQPTASIKKDGFIITDELIDKWGDGYSENEYISFERKYNMLKNNYQERTAMHTEALLTYIRYRAKEELATAGNDSKAAKEWGTLAKDAATAAKINPSQLSKSDLSDGLDTFGQLVRSVEQAVDIIPILPQFKERPQDKADFTLFCYVNYIRDMKGLPLVEYKEIYEFYEVRKREYESSFETSTDIEGEE